MEPALYLYPLFGLMAILAQVVLAELALERAAPSDEVRKWTKNNDYWEQLAPTTSERTWKLFGDKGWLHFRGGQAIGVLETILLYTALCVFRGQAAGIVIAGYLAFKVACKWEVWSHVYRLSESSVKDSAEEQDWKIFRSKLGHSLFTRFVAGTIISLLIAIFASVAFHWTTQ